MPQQRTDPEHWACLIAEMQREDLTDFLLQLNCTFQLDFTAEYLDSQPVEGLRHLALAALLHHRPRAASA